MLNHLLAQLLGKCVYFFACLFSCISTSDGPLMPKYYFLVGINNLIFQNILMVIFFLWKYVAGIFVVKIYFYTFIVFWHKFRGLNYLRQIGIHICFLFIILKLSISRIHTETSILGLTLYSAKLSGLQTSCV